MEKECLMEMPIIYGPEENLLINLKGSTNKNTSLVIPIKDSGNVR